MRQQQPIAQQINNSQAPTTIEMKWNGEKESARTRIEEPKNGRTSERMRETEIIDCGPVLVRCCVCFLFVYYWNQYNFNLLRTMTLGCFSFRGVFKSCSTPNDMCWLFFFLTFSHCFAVGLVHCDEHWETQDWANQQRTCACVFLSSPQHSRFFVCCFREVMIHDFKSYVKKTYEYMKLMECSTHAYGIIRVNFFSLFISFIVFFFVDLLRLELLLSGCMLLLLLLWVLFPFVFDNVVRCKRTLAFTQIHVAIFNLSI